METWDELLDRQRQERDEHPTVETRAGLEARYRRDVERLEYRERQDGMAQARQRRIDDSEAAEQKNRQILEDRINAQVAATHPSQVLNELRAAGVSLEADSDGAITIQPAGKLSQVQRRVIDAHRGEVVAMIRAAQRTEVL